MSKSAWLACIALVCAATAQSNGNPYEARTPGTLPASEIDARVFAQLEQLDIRRSPRCSDAVFVRRVFLDVLGTLPTAEEARRFLRDDDPRKREQLIAALLERDELADFFALRWSDVLRVKSEFPINLWPNAAQAYHRWIRDRIADATPYDRFARELLTSSGSNFRVAPVNFYRALQGTEPEAIAGAVALTFMGCRADAWPAARRAGLAGFFARIGYKPTAEWKEEIVFFDASKPVVPAVFPDGTPAELDGDADPRIAFADWLLAPDNPWFARAFANRVWSWLLGRGLVEPPDDLRADNPPVHPELLAWLEDEVVRSGFDFRHLLRVILESETYQQSSIPRGDPERAAAHFACYPVRRLEAEVLIDAINQVTGGREGYTSAIPEPFTYVPPDHRTITLPDASITSPFLELFGRPPRDTGTARERNDAITAAQRLHLLNSSHVQQKIQPRDRRRAARGEPDEIVERTYLTILSRFPTAAERRAVLAYAEAHARDRSRVAADVVWALINTTEFLYRH